MFGKLVMWELRSAARVDTSFWFGSQEFGDRPVEYLFCSALRPEKRRLEHANFHNGSPASKSDEKLGASALLTVHHVNETNHGHPPWLSPISCDPAKLGIDAGHAP